MVSKVGLKTVFASFVAALALYAPVPSAGEQSDKTAAAGAARPALDYEFFKARVQPIFLKTRSEDHVRCYACHQVSRHPAGLHLELLPPGQNTWTEEQSRRNFETVSKLVVPGTPRYSPGRKAICIPGRPRLEEHGGMGARPKGVRFLCAVAARPNEFEGAAKAK
ncbi:MAG: hypothetical protein DMG12_05670 [Acidobacteria bacterium]|nr:MAG: hypothetical protein DMG12_05670 [Acidobacteriota bacterium]